MIPVFADTSYYVALLNANDSAHKLATEIASRLESTVATTNWVLAELANGLSASPLRGLFATWYERLRRDSMVLILPPTQEGFEQGVNLYVRHRDKDWSLTDCISFLVMREHGIRDALTADRHFEQAGFRALLK